tara:strand:+ start:317 stop:1390 length:1074 start_codon:yes stop_codon:yes gene_type:complete
MKVVFDVQHLYYLPQYLPVIDVLKEFTQEIKLIGYESDNLLLNKIVKKSLVDTGLEYEIVEDWKEALSNYLLDKPHWIIFGNAVSNLDQLHKASKTVLMQHGVGPKSIYYEVSKNPTSVRFVEGNKRLSKLNKMFPNGNFIDSGFAKLDPVVNKKIKIESLSSLGLDESKPTLLYAPTFYPSSIELFSKNFPEDFKDFNIILKPHFFSLTLNKYKGQRHLLEAWGKFNNVYLTKIEDYNLINFIIISDVLISDASSSIFEFAALDKPVIWCDFYKLRWSYRGLFSFRFKKRIDESIEVFHRLCERAENYKNLKNAVLNTISYPDSKKSIRNTITQDYVGKVDGLCSKRIVEYLRDNK